MTTPSYEDLERKVTYLEVVVAQHEEQARATLRGYGMVVEQRESALAENRRLSAKLAAKAPRLSSPGGVIVTNDGTGDF
jgi:hypothetical protein